MVCRTVLVAVLAVAFSCNCSPVPSMKYETFRSPPVSLRSGQIANTPGNFGPLEFPKGKVAVRHFSAQVVDKHNNPITLEELYVHHWILFNSFINGGLCPNLPNIWGIGAELRGTKYDYPAPYAVVLSGEETWTANLHFIRTTNVDDIQPCIECRCPDSTPENPHGGIACCEDGSMCWGMKNSTIMDAKDYYLQYTIGYVPYTDDIVALTTFSMDVTATRSVDCQIEYQIPQLADGEKSTLSSTTVAPTDWKIVYAEVHQHIGGEQFTIEHIRDGKSLGVICESDPVYGSGGHVAGNETGYVVAIPPCHFPQGYEVKKGEGLKLTSVYTNRGLPGGVNYHEGVMGLAYIAAVAKESPEESCEVALNAVCGSPPYSSAQQCESCAESSETFLKSVGCTPTIVKSLCSHTTQGGNIPAPTEVTGMTLHVNKLPDGDYLVDAIGPSTEWWAVGFNADAPAMLNATAWIVSYNSNLKYWTLEERRLGYHASGELITANYNIEHMNVVNSTVEVRFLVPGNSVPSSKNSDVDCYLFAQGDNVQTFGYHGASRGTTCVGSSVRHDLPLEDE